MKRLGIFLCVLLILSCAVACGNGTPDTTDIHPWPTDLFFSDLPPAAEKVTLAYAIAEDGSAYSVLIEQMEYEDFYAYVTTLKDLGFTATDEQGLTHATAPDSDTLLAYTKLTNDSLTVEAQWTAPQSTYRFGNNAVNLRFYQNAK